MGLDIGRSPWRYFAALLVLFGAYFLTARFGLQFDPVGGFATFVWPPTGIAIAFLLFFGGRLWPGIFLGAFVVNWSLGASAPVALVIGIGNTLEAVAALYLLRSFGFEATMGRVRDVLQLTILGALISPMLGATVGSFTLAWKGIVSASDYAATWQAWWVGDALGALVVAPLILIFLRRRSFNVKKIPRTVELAVFLVVFVLIDVYVFSASQGANILSPSPTTVTYFLLLPLFWAALRFGQGITAACAFLTSAYAIWATVSGMGPFGELGTGLNLLYAQLFIAVAAATSLILAAAIAELERTEAYLRLTNKRKDDFLAILSHELRNPLAVMSTSLEIAEIQGVSGDLLPSMKKQLHHMGRLLEDLLDSSRVSHGKVKLHLEVMDGRKIVEQAVESTAPLRSSRQQHIQVALPPEPVPLRVDQVRLVQVVINLLNNASKYTDPGGRMWVDMSRSKDVVTIKVRDSGIGIPKSALESIFKPFSQLDRSLNRSQGGLGVGLDLARRLVEMHGGRISVASDGVGKGSCFTVRLKAWKDKRS